MLGIDVSENNNLINWQDIVDAGCKFAIIRSSYGRTNEDEMFTLSVQAAHAAGLKCGAYHYSYALTPEQAIEEAAHCAEIINASGELLELPVFFDMEDADQYKANHGFEFSGENVTEICRSFITSLGLKCGVYASESWFDTYIDYESLHCPVWNAAWLSNPDADPAEHTGNDGIQDFMWQYTDSLNISGQLFDGDWLYE